ncbi:type IV pilus modification PilV family protein [Desulfurobacterium sp.]
MKNAFTILEVLISVVIFSVVMAALIDAAGFYYRLSLETDLLNAASRVAKENLEEIRNMDYGSVTQYSLNHGVSSCAQALNSTANVETVQLRNTNFKFGKYFDVVVNSGLNLKEVTVHVCWNFRGNLKEVKYSTIVRAEK